MGKLKPPTGIPKELIEATERELDAEAEEIGKEMDSYLAQKGRGEVEMSQIEPSQGQEIADQIAGSYTRAGALAMKPTVEHLLSAIETSTSPKDLKVRLENLYKHLDSGALGEVVQKAMMLAELDGRWSVLEEA